MYRLIINLWILILINCDYCYNSNVSKQSMNISNLNCTDYIQLFQKGNITKLEVPFSCVKYPLGLEVFLGILLTLIVIGSIGGNFLVILAVFLVQKLRTPNNILIVNLAASDFLVSVTVLPIMVYNQLSRYRWPFKETICDIYISFDVILCTSSILNLCAISIDRYLVITKPLAYLPKRTNILMFAMISVAWLISILITIPAAIGWKQPFKEGQCQYSNNLGYQIYATLGAFYIPLAIMLVLYYRIFKLARRMAKEDSKRMVGMTQLTSDDDNSNENVIGNNEIDDSHLRSSTNLHTNNSSNNNNNNNVTTNNNANNYDEENNILLKNTENNRRSDESTSGLNTKIITNRRKKSKPKKPQKTNDSKAIRTLGVIMGCFTLCWLPFFIIQIINPILISLTKKDDILPPWLFEFFVWLGYINSFLNPIIYAKFNREFRNPFKEILLCHCGSINRRLRTEAYAAQTGRAALSTPTPGHHPHARGSSGAASVGMATLSVAGDGGGSHSAAARIRRRSSDPFTAVSRKNRLATSSTPRVVGRQTSATNVDQAATTAATNYPEH